MKILCFSLLSSTVWSFSPTVVMKAKLLQDSSLHYYPQEFERAVECANEYGLCDFDELGRLADGKMIETTLYQFLWIAVSHLSRW